MTSSSSQELDRHDSIHGWDVGWEGICLWSCLSEAGNVTFVVGVRSVFAIEEEGEDVGLLQRDVRIIGFDGHGERQVRPAANDALDTDFSVESQSWTWEDCRLLWRRYMMGPRAGVIHRGEWQPH